MKISVVGTGYVGLSLAVLLSRKHEVVAVDIIPEKVDMINSGKSPIVDREIESFLAEGKLNLTATTDIGKTAGSAFVIIATPTNYDSETHYFNTKSVEGVMSQLQDICPDSAIVVKSTVPIGFTEGICKNMGYSNVLFSPEFLREGRALYDNLHPSRIIVGVPSGCRMPAKAEEFAKLLADASEEEAVKAMVIGSTEAESVKLFSNTYLAMRVAYFNELDTFAKSNNLNAEEIIRGVSMDPRVGDYYNNPSFGYGGYCLPKDTKQLLANYSGIPNSLMAAIVESNAIRKHFIVSEIEKMAGRKATVGVYRLVMKSGSDNFRESAVIDVLKQLSAEGYSIIIYEPTISEEFQGFALENDLKAFKEKSEVIISNRFSKDLEDCRDKVFCRDLFNKD